jgi:hypothetical protein
VSRIGVVVVRRFTERVARADRVTEARRACELPFVPAHGMALAFADGSGEVVVSRIRLRVEAPTRLGVLPTEVEVLCCQEPATGLEAACATGWEVTG